MNSPATIDSSLAWHGRDLDARRNDWILHLDSDDIRELEMAARAVLDRDIVTLRADDFPLGRLDRKLRDLRDTVVDRIGFTLMRGLPVDRWPRAICARVFWAIGSRIGQPVCQNPDGHFLGHVKDIGTDALDPDSRGYQSSAALPFHNDIGAEIVGLFCLQPARSGGLSSVLSAAAAWNLCVQRAPDLARVLTEPFHIDRRGEVADGQQPFYTTPVFMPAGKRMTVNYIRRFIMSGQRHRDVPALRPEQVAAMDLLDDVLATPGLRLEMEFRPGDIQWVNNLVTLHTRTAYVDWPQPDRRRHLYRLWLCVPDGWPLPVPFHSRHGTDSATGRPLGLALPPGVRPSAPLDVTIRAPAAV